MLNLIPYEEVKKLYDENEQLQKKLEDLENEINNKEQLLLEKMIYLMVLIEKLKKII